MIQLTSPNALMTHAATLAEYRLADNFMADIEALTAPNVPETLDLTMLALAFLNSIDNPGKAGNPRH